MYVTLKLDDNRCRIHSVSDGNEEIVTNQRYVVMPWKMVTRHSTNMALKVAVEEIKAREEERKLVSKFEAKHRDEIDKILGLIDYIDKWYMEKISLRFMTLAASDFENPLVIESYTTDFLVNRGYSQLDYFKKTFRAYQGRDEYAVKYVEKVKALIDKPLDEIELGHVRLAMKKLNVPANWIFQCSIN